MAKRKSTNKIISSIVIVLILVAFSFIGEKLGFFDKNDNDTSVIDGAFSVHFIDVGQGDCVLIKTDKGNMLIDAGENGYEDKVLDYFSEHSITSLEYFVLTHPHSDHIGGAAEVISNVTVKNVIMPKLSSSNTPTSKTFEKTLLAVNDSGCNAVFAKPGNEYSFGDVKFTVLSPFAQDENLNNMSVTLKLTYGTHSFMFTGDAEKEVENQLLDAGYDLSADVFKLAHHGSSTSNSVDFINAVNPQLAVISYGKDNSYGHPHDEVVEMLEEERLPYYSTARNGDVVITAQGDELVVNFEKE